MQGVNVTTWVKYSAKVTLLISGEARNIFMFINYMVLVNIITVFGCVTNVLNIVVFVKQGFSNTINISLLGLAVSDLLSLVTLLWFDLCLNPLFESSDVPIVPPEIQHLTGGIPHICFVRITGWITVFITAERCLCMTMPLKIKTIITPRRTKVIISLIFTAILVSFFPEYSTSYIDWKFYPEKNKTLLGLVFTSNRKSMEGVVFFMYSFLGTTCFVTVIIFTAVLIAVSLKRKSTWRRKASADRECSVTSRDRKTVTMVVLLATIVIICYIPGVAVSIVVFFVPEFSIVGRYVNAFFVAWSFTFIFESTNASVNIFLYYTMSTKYRHTFRELFCRHHELTGDTSNNK